MQEASKGFVVSVWANPDAPSEERYLRVGVRPDAVSAIMLLESIVGREVLQEPSNRKRVRRFLDGQATLMAFYIDGYTRLADVRPITES